MRAILLTGSTGGLGESLVKTLLDVEDSKLICLYRNQDKYDNLLKHINSIRGYLTKLDDDFSELIGCNEIRESDSIVLILNAFAISPIKRVGDYSSDEIKEFTYGNITRNVLLMNTVVNCCKNNGKALRIINLDSGAADYPLTGWGNYCAAKAYINSFISVVGKENPDFEIVSFDPGVMNTDMQAEIRTINKDVFDQVDVFKGYKEDKVLREPIDVAKQIKERYVEAWNVKNIREKM